MNIDAINKLKEERVIKGPRMFLNFLMKSRTLNWEPPGPWYIFLKPQVTDLYTQNLPKTSLIFKFQLLSIFGFCFLNERNFDFRSRSSHAKGSPSRTGSSRDVGSDVSKQDVLTQDIDQSTTPLQTNVVNIDNDEIVEHIDNIENVKIVEHIVSIENDEIIVNVERIEGQKVNGKSSAKLVTRPLAGKINFFNNFSDQN